MNSMTSITPPKVNADADRTRVMRQALAGMLWTKQYFYYDVTDVAQGTSDWTRVRP